VIEVDKVSGLADPAEAPYIDFGTIRAADSLALVGVIEMESGLAVRPVIAEVEV